MKVTVHKLAEVTGMSPATIDRVLNDRPGVRARTRERVLAAARNLGYRPDAAENSALTPGFDVLLPPADNVFMVRLRDAIVARANAVGVNVRVAHLELSAQAYAEALRRETTSEGVALIAPDHPEVREALRALSQRGVPVFTMISDLPGLPRTGYIGTDNHAAGRLVGQLVSRFLGPDPGPAALFVGTTRYRGHSDRVAGFTAAMGERAPHVEILPTRETLDRDEGCIAALDAALARAPNLSAIYNTGSGSATLAEALEQRGLAAQVILIGHELTEGTRRALISGALDAVIDQNAERQALLAVEALVAAREGRTPDLPPALPPVLILRENLPA